MVKSETRRWLVSYGIYLLIGACAYAVAWLNGIDIQWGVILFLIGYAAGRITKGIER